jgi:hypothetical protein
VVSGSLPRLSGGHLGRQLAPDSAPLPIDINHGDLLNAFGEMRLFARDGRTLSARYGRQELLFGNQRLVSPLDWANTRRTFDDVARVLYRSKSWDIDGFWGRPFLADPRRFDHGDQSRQFFGAYGVYKGIANQVVDLYYLGLVETDPVAAGSAGVLGDSDVHTLGMRWQGSRNDWLWETEAAYQFGRQADLNRNAGMATGGIGRRLSKRFGKPELWFYYDWASGDRNRTTTTSTCSTSSSRSGTNTSVSRHRGPAEHPGSQRRLHHDAQQAGEAPGLVPPLHARLVARRAVQCRRRGHPQPARSLGAVRPQRGGRDRLQHGHLQSTRTTPRTSTSGYPHFLPGRVHRWHRPEPGSRRCSTASSCSGSDRGRLGTPPARRPRSPTGSAGEGTAAPGSFPRTRAIARLGSTGFRRRVYSLTMRMWRAPLAGA